MASGGAVPKTQSVHSQKFDYMDTTAKYLQALQKEIESNESEQNKLTVEINKIREKMDEINQLAERPEWPDSFIQVNPLAYVPATIIHTGEHYVELGPQMYALMSLKETLGFLQRKLERVQTLLNVYETQHEQLEERGMLFTDAEIADTEDMPSEITSEIGVACKTTGGFYEVIEPYVVEEERMFYKRRQESTFKRGKEKKKTTNEADSFFVKLDELQELEELRGELVRPENDKIDEHTNISDRIRVILRQSGFYKKLLDDRIIQQHCYKNKTNETRGNTSNESALNELVVKALISEPVIYLSNAEKSKDFNIDSMFSSESEDKHETNDPSGNISSNDLSVSAFLDNIEQDMKSWSL